MFDRIVRTVLAATLLALSPLPAATGDISGEIDRLLNSERLAGSGCRIGLVVMDPETGELLAEHDPDERFIPASNMKLLSSGAALSLLGPEFEFRTDLAWSPEAGGRILVRGSGDPALADPKLLMEMELSVEDLLGVWIDALRAAGVTHARELVIDDRVFDRELVHPTWPPGQLNRWYCAEVSGLTFHTNYLSVFTEPTREGRPPNVRLEPHAPWIQITNNARTVKKGQHTAWAAREHGTNAITLRGDIRWGTDPVEVTLHDIPAFFGRLFADRLASAGIETETVRLASDDESFAGLGVLHTVRTPMPVVLERCNKDSYNLYAECLLKRLGHEVTRSPGSWANGAAVIRMEMLERIGTSAGSDVRVADGSGMSRNNSVTPRMLALWLASFHADERVGDAFFESLPVAGAEGTLSKRFKKRMPRHEVRAKSGYLTGVSALSGCVTHRETGRRVVFSIITNDKPNRVPLTWVREFEEQVVLLAEAWLDTAVAGAHAEYGG